MTSCANKISKPSYVLFENTEDSLYVIAKGKFKSPFHIRVKKEEIPVTDISVVFPDSLNTLMGFRSSEMDSTKFLKEYKFESYLGDPSNAYDTMYNYTLPFPKKKSYKILQGTNTNFTHKGLFSSYALDFRMPVGDTICAARNGYVVHVTEHNTKQGRDKSYRDFANFITLAHDDGTFSQYVHLKKDGALVDVDDYVEKGEVIGLSGNTGWSSEPHLHFAVFKVEPFQFISIPISINGIQSIEIKKWDIMGH